MEATHCKNGHEFTPENTYWYGENRDRRSCRKCRNDNAIRSKKNNPEHRQKQRIASLKWWNKKVKENPNFRHDIHLRTTYGISHEDYERMFKDQNGKCAICDRPPENGKLLNVDHCHTSDMIRKLLCAPCNQALGFFQDRPELLIKAAQYLKEFQ